jgi:TolA-binding protein
VVRVPPVDHPDDLPPTALTTATSDLAIANENLRNENSDLRGSIAELNVRVSDLMLQLHEAKTELHNFKFEQEQKGEGTAEAPFEAPMIGVETSSRKKG